MPTIHIMCATLSGCGVAEHVTRLFLLDADDEVHSCLAGRIVVLLFTKMGGVVGQRNSCLLYNVMAQIDGP